jgi:hypothetical protein
MTMIKIHTVMVLVLASLGVQAQLLYKTSGNGSYVH